MPHLTPEQRKDVEERTQAFAQDLDALKTKYQVDIGYMPQWIQGPPGAFVTVVVADVIDMKYRNPSPLHAAKA